MLIAKAMLNHLNCWPSKPAEVKLEAFEKNSPSMILQQLSGAVKVREYINGSYVGSWPFAVYIRVSGEDTSSKLDAAGTLLNLSDWLSSSSPDIGANRTVNKIEMTSLPSIAERHENGEEDYQAIFVLEYKVGGKS